MMIGTRTALTALGMGLVVSLASLAQDPSPKAKAESTAPQAKKKADPSRRVPAYFGQIGLKPDQRESIYKIRGTHQAKIEALRAQIEEAEAKSLAECEAVLTDTQKKLLENLRVNRASKGTEAAKTSK